MLLCHSARNTHTLSFLQHETANQPNGPCKFLIPTPGPNYEDSSTHKVFCDERTNRSKGEQKPPFNDYWQERYRHAFSRLTSGSYRNASPSFSATIEALKAPRARRPMCAGPTLLTEPAGRKDWVLILVTLGQGYVGSTCLRWARLVRGFEAERGRCF